MIVTINELEKDKKYEVSVVRNGGSAIIFNKTYNEFFTAVKTLISSDQTV